MEKEAEMGFLEKAKQGLSSKFGDETVRKREVELEDSEEELHNNATSRAKETAKPLEVFQDDFVDQGNSIADILESMKIKPTFTVPDDLLYIDDELANTEFSIQAPQGYDMGEVDFFVQKSQKSIAKYVEFLKVRNKDVNSMASRISSLVESLNDLKFKNEMANGINIMAGGDNDLDELELKNTELRLTNARLQEEVDFLKSSGVINEDFGSSNGDSLALQDQLSLVTKEKNEAVEELHQMVSRLNYLEEELNIKLFNENGQLNEAPVYASSSGGFTSKDEEIGFPDEELNMQSEHEPMKLDNYFTEGGIREVELPLDELDSSDEPWGALPSFDDPPLPEEETISYASHEEEQLPQFAPALPDVDSTHGNNERPIYMDTTHGGFFDEEGSWIVDDEVRGFKDDDGYFREGYFDEEDNWHETALFDEEGFLVEYEEEEYEEEEYEDSALSDPGSPFVEYEEISLDDFDSNALALPDEDIDFSFEPEDSLNSDFSNSEFQENSFKNLEEFIDKD